MIATFYWFFSFFLRVLFFQILCKYLYPIISQAKWNERRKTLGRHINLWEKKTFKKANSEKIDKRKTHCSGKLYRFCLGLSWILSKKYILPNLVHSFLCSSSKTERRRNMEENLLFRLSSFRFLRHYINYFYMFNALQVL